MITAVEQGRKLIITAGEAGTDDAIVIPVSPVNARVGAGIFALWAGVGFGQSEQPEVDAENFSRMAIGEENWSIIDEELRWKESELVINAAVFWQTQGGGIELVNELLSGGGFPKAQETLLRANGLWEAWSALRTLLSGESENPTQLAATLATTIPSGTETPSSPTVDRLPMEKRSIHQDQT